MTARTTTYFSARTTRFARIGASVLAVVLCAALLPLAAMRANSQDDASYWRELADRHIDSEDLLGWSAPYGLRAASLTLAADETEGARVLMRPVDDDLQTFNATHIDRARFSTAEINCLAQAIYYEARGESFAGQAAVAEVIMNRVSHRVYPDTICGVVYDGSERSTGCQFSFTCDGSMERTPRGRSWRRSQLVAEHVAIGFAPPQTRRATHYHTTAINPHWSGSLVQTGQIGTHVFYRFPSRRERAELERDL